MRPPCTDMQCVRVALTYKFILGALIVGIAVVALPKLLEGSGVGVASWVAPFVALGAGGALGYFLSRSLASSFTTLLDATHRISGGDLTALTGVHRRPRFPDETWDLACSIERMAAGLYGSILRKVTRNDFKPANKRQPAPRRAVIGA